MKKILLIIAIVFCIFQMVVMAIDIDIGDLAIDRGTSIGGGRTLVNKGNSANASGKITNVKIWASNNMTGCEVATFFVVSGNNLSTRDTYYIGNVTAGSQQSFAVDLNVEAGDYIGIHFDLDGLECDTNGTDGMWYSNTGTDLIPCENATFNFITTYILSLYGTGTTAVGWDHKWNTQTISKWNTKEIIKWNDLE